MSSSARTPSLFSALLFRPAPQPLRSSSLTLLQKTPSADNLSARHQDPAILQPSSCSGLHSALYEASSAHDGHAQALQAADRTDPCVSPQADWGSVCTCTAAFSVPCYACRCLFATLGILLLVWLVSAVFGTTQGQQQGSRRGLQSTLRDAAASVLTAVRLWGCTQLARVNGTEQKWRAGRRCTSQQRCQPFKASTC